LEVRAYFFFALALLAFLEAFFVAIPVSPPFMPLRDLTVALPWPTPASADESSGTFSNERNAAEVPALLPRRGLQTVQLVPGFHSYGHTMRWRNINVKLFIEPYQFFLMGSDQKSFRSINEKD
jgi:hypothetical protein